MSVAGVNVRMLAEIFIKDYQNAKAMADASSNITETFLRSRNRIASGFILYPIFSNILHVHHHSEKNTLHSSESTTKDHLPLVLLC